LPFSLGIHSLSYPFPSAALKCRQRKKAWLASLQSKIESLTGENERLKKALGDSRDEIARLTALVGSTGVVPLAVGGPGVQPVSMSVSVPRQNGAVAVSGPGVRASGYGY
jgi:ATF/CREB family transcription factor